MTARLLPPVAYFGGKTTLAPWLVDLLPGHGHFVEPFAGSLAVLLAKPRSRMETANDLDGALVNFWRLLRDRPDDLARVCYLTPHARAEHQASYLGVPDDHPDRDLERARRVWVQLTQGRAGVRSRTGWRHYQDPAGSSASMPAYLRGYISRITTAADRLGGVSLESRPALDLIRAYGRHDDVCLYVDPPYLESTRSSGSYLHEMTDADHVAMLDALLACKASVVLSGYPSRMYDDALADWERHEASAWTGQGGTWASRTEVAWCNRPVDRGLLDLLETEAAS